MDDGGYVINSRIDSGWVGSWVEVIGDKVRCEMLLKFVGF